MTRIKNPSLTWSETGLPASEVFGDVYYSRHNGLEEARHVFINGNNLPQAWLQQDNFVIAETGFGTGLNFLATWKLFEETARQGERLDFISIEQFPLARDDLAKSLQPWRAHIGDKRIERFLKIYPPRFPGFHRRWVTDRITLTLIFDEAQRGFSQLDCLVDAWFLDGFSPAKNPEMWQQNLFRHMARLSHRQTTLASFTAATFVRRGLQEAGFAIERKPGFGYKSHRITGSFIGDRHKMPVQKPETVTIIGAGLAGSAACHALNRRGIKTIVVDKENDSATGASGNRLGLINPRIEAQDNPRSDAGLAAFSFAGHILQGLPMIDYQKTGALHLTLHEGKHQKLAKIYAASGWLEPHRQWLSQAEIQALTKLNLQNEGLFYTDAAKVNPSLLVKAMLGKNQVAFQKFIDESSMPAGPVILACGWGLKAFSCLEKLPLQPVRGQVTYARIPEFPLPVPLMAGSYVAPVGGDVFCLGASFDQNDDNPLAKTEDDTDNIANARKILGNDLPGLEITGHWANVRTASRDRFPIVGQVPGHENLYVTGALGSHGIQFSLLHGEILACLLTGAPLPVGGDALNCLSINRFYRNTP